MPAQRIHPGWEFQTEGTTRFHSWKKHLLHGNSSTIHEQVRLATDSTSLTICYP